jgi:uncharacterized membrane protein
MVLVSLLLELSIRKQKEFFKQFFQTSVSATTASKLLRKLEEQGLKKLQKQSN